MQGDAFLLRQALSNLLDNAIAFSAPGGRIVLSVQRQQQNWRIAVRDNGPGVPEYAQEQDIERFYSLARPGTGQRSSGLGLPFVAEVARLHGGVAQLGNHPDGGAEARLLLPVG